MRVLVIAAHPDDEAYGVGATMKRLSVEGHEVHTLIVTDGSSTQYPGDSAKGQKKLEECRNANDLLGVRKVYFGGLPDMKLDTVPHVRINEVVSSAVEACRPDWVFTHHSGDVNKDHEAVFESTLVACRPLSARSVKRLYCYEVPSSTEWAGSSVDRLFSPNVFVDISRHLDAKRQACEAYETELRGAPHPRSPEGITGLAVYRGGAAGLRYAEAFSLIRDIM